MSKIESSLRRSVEGLVKALEEQEDKTQQLEKELKSMSCLLEGIDTLDTVMKGINGGQGAEQGGAKSPPAASKGDGKRGLMALPSSASSAGTTSSAKKKENIKKSRRKTIIPVLAQLPGASSSSKPSAERPTSDSRPDAGNPATPAPGHHGYQRASTPAAAQKNLSHKGYQPAPLRAGSAAVQSVRCGLRT